MTNFFPNRESVDDPLLERLRKSTVGLYDVAGEIGRGGMAVVYIATDVRLGRKVAIKVMEPRLNFTPGMAERFLQEARIAAQLQHHNIIVVHEVRHDEELIFFVMRVVEGGSLDEIYRRLAQQNRQLPVDQAQWILWQSARALAYAHSEGIIHRDVKPANILISTKGEVVVTDFGIAKAVDAEGLTKSGMAIGTPTYMSPEQFVGPDALSGASDQYALGIAAYEMLTGAPPFKGDLFRIIAQHGSTPAPDLRDKRPDCPAPLAEAVMRMLEKKPSDRWPSLDAVLPVLGQGLAIDGSTTRADLASIATELQDARRASVAAWGAVTPVTPSWSSSGSRRRKTTSAIPAAITVSPPNAQVVSGKQLALRAVVTSDLGNTIADAVVRWTTSDPSVATVSADGEVTGVHSGSASIGAEVVPADASAGAVRAVAELLVTEREITRIQIREGDLAIEGGEARRLNAELLDEDGNSVESANVLWASSRPEVVHVDERGTVLALSGGQAVISARVGGVQGSVRVTVREAPVGAVQLHVDSDQVDAGAVVPITLVVTDISGLPRSDSGLVVLSDAPEVATVQLSPLALLTHAAGTVTLRVRSREGSSAAHDGASEPWATVTLVVRPAVVVAVAEAVKDVPAAVTPAVGYAPEAEPSAVADAPEAVAPPAADAPAADAPEAESPARTGPLPKAEVLPEPIVVPEVRVLPIRPNPRTFAAVAGVVVVLVSVGMFLTRDSRAKAAAARADAGTVTQETVNPAGATTGDSGAVSGSPVAGVVPGQDAGAAGQTPPDGSPANGTNAATSASRGGNSPSQSGATPGRGRAGNPANTSTAVLPPPPARSDTAVAPEPVPAPVKAPEVVPPSESEMRRLAREYVLRLERGEFRTGSLASFFSGTTSSHRASLVGEPRVAGREGDALLADVEVQLERTMGSGAVQRRATVVRLVLRGRPGAAVIESATPGAITNGR